MKIAIIGTGYVGTVAGACFAESGHHVICVDHDQRKVDELNRGKPVIYEPGLEELLKRNLKKKRIRFSSSIAEAVSKSEVIFMTVGTPASLDGSADLSFLENAAREVGRAMRSPKIIVNKSTVPVGTHRKVATWIREETRVAFEVVSNPEFLREGAALDDFLRPDRVVIGTDRLNIFKKMRDLYRPIVKSHRKVVHMDPISAELTKYACNAFLATRISFMNDLSHLCSKAGGDIEAIKVGMGLDQRIGPQFLSAGIGYGGSCFPKDIRALLSTAAEHAVDLKIVSAAEEVNERQKRVLLPKLLAHLRKPFSEKRVAIWGLSFKPGTDDIREAPALVLIQELLRRGVRVVVYDPVAMPNVYASFGSKIQYGSDLYDAVKGADALVIATEWPEFKRADLKKVKKLMQEPSIFDGRNLLSPDQASDAGFSYVSVGRKPREKNAIRSLKFRAITSRTLSTPTV